MQDTAALVALVVAVVALVVASAQLTQQLLATAYVLRKCDSIVTGGLTEGGTRQWHWRQFRFTVKYQAVVFTLPRALYASLGINSTIQITPSSTAPSSAIWDRAKSRQAHRKSAQGCWVTLIQDLVDAECLLPEDVCAREESGDRIPDDLTVAPTRVDCMAILLSAIAMGMQVFKYSPTTGEITLGGANGSVSSSAHPVLGALLHYSAFPNDSRGSKTFRHHAQALRHSEGVWANAVFGRFRDKSYRPEMMSFEHLMTLKTPVLLENGWPDLSEPSDADTTGGAACFMIFGHIDVCGIVPPSVVREFCAHFAEVIVKAHHVEVLKQGKHLESSFGDSHVYQACKSEANLVHTYGCSSPHVTTKITTSTNMRKHLDFNNRSASRILPCQNILKTLEPFTERSWKALCDNDKDPSSYCSVEVLMDMLCMVDACLGFVFPDSSEIYRNSIRIWSDRIVAKAILTLSTVGAPSWGHASNAIEAWPSTVATACKEVLKGVEDADLDPTHRHELRRILPLHAELSLLRSAYYTVMMRAAHPLGPGLAVDADIETALAYMA